MDSPLRATLLAASADAIRESRPGGPTAASDRPDGRHRISHHRAADRPLAARSVTHGQRLVRGIPVVDAKVAESSERGRQRRRTIGLQTAYCAETVAITYEEMGLLTTEKHSNWFDPGSFWSGDTLGLAAGYRLGDEVEVTAT